MEEEEKRFQRRSGLLLGFFALCLACFVMILYDAQVVNKDAYLAKSSSQVTTTQPVAACNNRDRTVYLQGKSGCIAFYDGSSVVGKTKLAAGEKYWVALAWNGNASKVYLAKDDNTLLPEELPALEDAFWSLEASAAGRELFAGNAFRLGQNGGTNTYWRGELDILKTRITVDGETTMFGSNWGNVFQTVGMLSKKEESVFVGPIYPTLPASRLEVFADWGKIRNIQAVLKGE